MINRKEKIYIIQILFLIIGLVILFYTYSNKNSSNVNQTNLITEQDSKKIQNADKDEEGNDVFYNIKYSGLDLAGNRYMLGAKKATTDKKILKL